MAVPAWRSLLIYGIVLGFVAWCAIAFRRDLAQIRIEPVIAAWHAVLLTALLSIVNYLLRALRWRFYLATLGHPMRFQFSLLSYLAGFAFTLSPGKVGELVRGGYYLRSGVPMSTTAAAFFVERLMDLLAMLVLALLALAAGTTYRGLIQAGLLGIAVALPTLAFAPWPRALAWARDTSRLPRPLSRAAIAIISALVDARALLSVPVLALGLGAGLLAWGAEGLGLLAIATVAPSSTLDAASATGIYAIAVIVGALSFLPGGLGGTEAVMIALLTAQGFTMPDAILVTLLCRLLTLWFAVLLGWFAVMALRRAAPTGSS